jgi:hypothetical protein
MEREQRRIVDVEFGWWTNLESTGRSFLPQERRRKVINLEKIALLAVGERKSALR